MPYLRFTDLQEVNFKRCVVGFKHKLRDWSVLEWAGAAAGEVGEACNVAKKLLRIRQDRAEQNLKGEIESQLRAMLADEIADAIIYLDLLASSEGIDLEEAIRKKFNEDSDKRSLGEFKL